MIRIEKELGKTWKWLGRRTWIVLEKTWKKDLEKDLEKLEKRLGKDLEEDLERLRKGLHLCKNSYQKKDLERLGKLLCQINTLKLPIPIAFMYNNIWLKKLID